MKQRKQAVLRCDASARIGAGHVLRSMALADALEREGWQIGFAVGAETLGIVPMLSHRGWRVESRFNGADREAGLLSGYWPHGVDLLVIDHYERAEPDERAMRPWARRVAVIDDLASRRHDCDLLIDQTLGRSERDYAPLVPAGAVILTGAQFALLRPEFARQRSSALARRASQGVPHRMLVALGATDPNGLTLKAVRTIMEMPLRVQIDAVVGCSVPSIPELKRLAAAESRLRVHVDTSQMCELMHDADLAVGAAGSSAWERCCLGLPSAMLVLADNQRLVAQSLQDAGAALLVDLEELPRRLKETLSRLYEDVALRRDMAAKAARVVDGAGSARVVARIEGLLEK